MRKSLENAKTLIAKQSPSIVMVAEGDDAIISVNASPLDIAKFLYRLFEKQRELFIVILSAVLAYAKEDEDLQEIVEQMVEDHLSR
jgi:hypothetical protein